VGVILIVSLPSRGVIVIPPAGDVKLKALNRKTPMLILAQELS